MGRHVRPVTETPQRPKAPAVPRGGKCFKAYSGLGNQSIFYPGSSVGSTIIRGLQKSLELYIAASSSDGMDVHHFIELSPPFYPPPPEEGRNTDILGLIDVFSAVGSPSVMRKQKTNVPL